MLELREIECHHEDRAIVRGLSMSVNAGQIVCLLGPSGCGKTTVLRAVAGFHPLTRGEIVINRRTVSRPGFTLAPEKRRLGMVFQDYALFPHMHVLDNVRFGLRDLPRAQQVAEATEMLERVGLAGFAQ